MSGHHYATYLAPPDDEVSGFFMDDSLDTLSTSALHSKPVFSQPDEIVLDGNTCENAASPENRSDARARA